MLRGAREVGADQGIMFARLLEKDFLESYDPSRARLRTFLRVCVDRLIANEEKRPDTD